MPFASSRPRCGWAARQPQLTNSALHMAPSAGTSVNEAQFDQPLLLRLPKSVSPTPAGSEPAINLEQVLKLMHRGVGISPLICDQSRNYYALRRAASAARCQWLTMPLRG